MTLRAVAALVLFAAGCDAPPAPDAGSLLRCDEGDIELSTTFYERWDPPSACASHDECELALTSVECPGDGARFSWCPTAVHRDDAASLQATLTEVLEEVCPRIPPSCRGGALCLSTVARCVGSRCVAVDASAACVEACSECLTRDSCLGHCGPHQACIVDAVGCDAIRTCVSGPPPDAG